MTPNEKIIAFIRTGVPYAVGAALAWLLATFALDLGGEFQVALVAFTVTAVTNLYYLLVRLVEVRVPAIGFFLGVPAAPEYSAVDNLWASVIRTGIPTVVGALVVSVVSGLWLHIDASTQAGLIVVLVGIVNALYYQLASFLTGRFSGLKVLLGTTGPQYDPARHLAV